MTWVSRVLTGFSSLCMLLIPTVVVHAAEPDTSAEILADLRLWLDAEPLSDDRLRSLAEQPFAATAVSAAEAAEARDLIWSARLKFLRDDRAAEVEKRELVIGDFKMPFWYKVFGDKPEGGRSLFISMHGGGGAPARINDSQYENQKRLYQPAEGVYLVPRAPTNEWNLWHQAHIDDFFERLIVDMVALEDVNPDRVYIMGYSAGGDGVYQLAPRMSDRLAAASMMAGHPNETQADGLRNIGFTLHMGGNDSAYKRNVVAEQWKTRLAELQSADPDGYKHHVEIHAGKGHWMDREDAVAVPWMAEFTRNSFPSKIVWLQDDVSHNRFYWIGCGEQKLPAGQKIVVSADASQNAIVFSECPVSDVTLRLNDKLVDLEKPVSVRFQDREIAQLQVNRSIAAIAQSLVERDDPNSIAYALKTVTVAPK